MSAGLPRPGSTNATLLESVRRTVEVVDQLQGAKDQPERAIRLRELTAAGLLTAIRGVLVRTDRRTLLLATTSIEASLTASPGTRYFVAADNLLVQLPANPIVGDIVQFVSGLTGGVAGFTISPNGKRIMGDTANVAVPTGDFAVTYVYFNSQQGWREA